MIDVVGLPHRYIASEATALVRFLNSGDARPAGKLLPIWERGVGGRPTLVDNAETLAQLALIARFGPDWFAAVGTAAEPGTTLVSIGGAVPRPGVVEVPHGAPLRDVLACAGAAPTGWALAGRSRRALGRPVRRWPGSVTAQRNSPRRAVTRGVGSIIVLPPGGCLLTETARILHYQAQRRCPAMRTVHVRAAGHRRGHDGPGRGDRGALDRLRRRLPVINGRGACSHPDGAVALAASALSALTTQQPGHLRQHLTAGGCHGTLAPLGAVTR